MLEALAGVAIKQLFVALFSTFFGWLEKREEGTKREELGASREALAVQKETIAANRRAAEVAANASTVDNTVSDLERGTF